MKILDIHGNEKNSGAFTELAQHIQEMTDSCRAVKGDQFAKVVVAQHGLLQMTNVLMAAFAAGAKGDEKAMDALILAQRSFAISAAIALADSMSVEDANESFNLSSDFFNRQIAMRGAGKL